MQKLANALGFPEPVTTQGNSLLPDGAVGIELELEGFRRNPEAPRGWEAHQDGSLREGIEYVFAGPQGGDQAVESINRMGELLANNECFPSFRCSTHIHMDVRDLDYNQINRLLVAYMVLEGTMFDHCSAERRWSNFCTPFFRNAQLVTQVRDGFMRTPDPRRKLRQLGAWPKYTALNLKPMTSFGSVEFRGSHALTTAEELLGLTQRMLNIRKLAVERDVAPLEFLESLMVADIRELIPTGLRDDYVVDQDLLERGQSNAFYLLSREPLYQEVAQPSRPSLAEMTANLPRHSPRSQTFFVVIKHHILAQRYNLDTRRMSGDLAEVIRLFKTLRNMRGVSERSLVLQDIIDIPRGDLHVRGLFADVARRHNLGSFSNEVLGVELRNWLLGP